MHTKDAKRKIILTGATGAIGLAVINKCIEMQWEVCAVVRPDSARNQRIPTNDLIHVIPCDLSEIYTLCKLDACKGADYFMHLAWTGTFGEQRNDDAMQQNNVKYALNACETAHLLGCEAFLFAGSQAEFGRVEGVLNDKVPVNPENAYGRAKLEAGTRTLELCRQKGMRHVYMRILSVYGPGDGADTMVSSTIRKLEAGISPQFTAGEQLWDYLYCDDAAEALVLACLKGKTGRIYCLGSGVARPLHEYISLIGQIVNPQIKLQIGALPYREKQVMHLCADISDLQEDFGFVPRIGFEEGIKRTYESGTWE